MGLPFFLPMDSSGNLHVTVTHFYYYTHTYVHVYIWTSVNEPLVLETHMINNKRIANPSF